MRKKLVRRMAAVALALALAGGVALPARAQSVLVPPNAVLRSMMGLRILLPGRGSSWTEPLPRGIAARIYLPPNLPDELLCGFVFAPEEMREGPNRLEAELSPADFQAFSNALAQGLPEQVRALGMQVRGLSVLDVQCDDTLENIRLTVDAPTDQRWDINALLPLLVQWAQRSMLMQSIHTDRAALLMEMTVEVYARQGADEVLLERFTMPFVHLVRGSHVYYTGTPVQVTPLPAPAGFTSFTLSPWAQALYFQDAPALAQYGEDVGTSRDARFMLSAEQLAAFRAALTDQFYLQLYHHLVLEDPKLFLDVKVLDDFSQILFYVDAQAYERHTFAPNEGCMMGWAMQYLMAMQKMLAAPGERCFVEAYVLDIYDRDWYAPNNPNTRHGAYWPLPIEMLHMRQ